MSDTVKILVVTASAVAVVGVWQTEEGKRRIRATVIRPVMGILSTMMSVVGFVSNFAVDVFHSKADEWEKVLKSIDEYIEKSGLKKELEQGANDRLIPNLAVLTTLQTNLPGRIKASQKKSSKTSVPPIERAQRYMKFATAAYGSDMIAAAQLEVDGMIKGSPDDSLEDLVSQHVGVPREDIIVSDLTCGGSMESLNHMIVKDNSEKAIVLAVRGTFSLSGIVVDLAGFAAEFCDGEAHSGIATMARGVWAKAIDSVRKALTEAPGYKLVLTGHSLGAGVACLMTILAYHEKMLPDNISIECLAFAPPPVFSSPESAKEAVASTTAYVHNMDLVPSLSVSAVRRLLLVVKSIDDVVQRLSFDQRASRAWQWMTSQGDPTEDLLEAVKTSATEELEHMEGAPLLSIPAKTVVWLDNTSKGDVESFGLHHLDSGLYARRLIDIHSDMVSDHMPPMYERACRYAVQHHLENQVEVEV